MNITQKIKYIGVNDKELDLFEGQYAVPNKMAYNSYVILDEKIAIFDTVDAKCGIEWLKNLENVLNGKAPNYLIVLHMEPDHSSSIIALLKKYPDITFVSSEKSFIMMNQFFSLDSKQNRIIVKDKDSLDLGEHTLDFISAPMVHWPEVIMAYERSTKTLFSADAFGKFGALDTDEEWICEARRYYFGIVGKYGVQVQNALKKLKTYDIKRICPLHGPILNGDIEYYINIYNIWSAYEPEEKGAFIAYTSVYGNTKSAVMCLKNELELLGQKVKICDLAREDMSEAVENAFKYDKLVLASTTYNAEIFPFMKTFINELTERNYQKRKIAIIENGSWAPTVQKKIKQSFENSKGIEFVGSVTILSSLSDENKKSIKVLANELIK